MTYIFCNQLTADDGTGLGTFSSHWPAVAAMIRQHIVKNGGRHAALH